jgi:hypothetical protein
VPNRPANRRPHNPTDNTVAVISTTVARFRHEEVHRPPWDNSSHQPRASMSTVTAKNGQVSTCNAGARASPAGVPPRKPSKPGTTHHQGSGSNPLSRPTTGLSTCSNFIFSSRFLSIVPSEPRIPAMNPGVSRSSVSFDAGK